MGGLDHLSHLARARARNRREGRQVVLVQDGQALALARHPAAIDQQRMLARRRRPALRIGRGLVHDGVLSLIITTRSEEHTSELQSLMRISYAVFCLKKKTNEQHSPQT